MLRGSCGDSVSFLYDSSALFRSPEAQLPRGSQGDIPLHSSARVPADRRRTLLKFFAEFLRECIGSNSFKHNGGVWRNRDATEVES